MEYGGDPFISFGPSPPRRATPRLTCPPLLAARGRRVACLAFLGCLKVTSSRRIRFARPNTKSRGRDASKQRSGALRPAAALRGRQSRMQACLAGLPTRSGAPCSTRRAGRVRCASHRERVVCAARALRPSGPSGGDGMGYCADSAWHLPLSRPCGPNQPGTARRARRPSYEASSRRPWPSTSRVAPSVPRPAPPAPPSYCHRRLPRPALSRGGGGRPVARTYHAWRGRSPSLPGRLGFSFLSGGGMGRDGMVLCGPRGSPATPAFRGAGSRNKLFVV